MRYLITALVFAGCAWGCAAQADSAPAAQGCHSNVARYDVSVPAHPFSVVQSRDGTYAFVSLLSSSPTSPTGVGVLKCAGGRYRYSHLVRFEASPAGMAITHDGKLLVVANEGFVTFIDTAAAVAAKPAIVGSIQDLEGDPEDNDPGSVYTNVSSDDHYVFVSDEQNLTITVIDLVKARAGGFSRSAIVGTIPVANAPVALNFSRDNRYLFTTSEVARKAYKWPTICKPEGSPAGTAPDRPAGAIITVDVAKAETTPDRSVVSKIPSDCSPVRMALSPDGTTAWVTNRGSNTVTAFDTAKLIAGDASARTATIPVGSNPVAIAATSDGRYVLTGNTNRFSSGGTTGGSISVIDTATKTVVGTLPAGLFPREFSHGNGTTLFLANYRSNLITVFDSSRLTELLK
jgi:YVTN family beta-propeller protein